ncbi:hypothetical protein SDC9_206403 [bioreactor metagenome]|uniref:Uncharacterized protein n=1 Tax=bioreactor metagenome TaxID=1076179 RepID=A0A645J6E6_9ZZZZ
MGLGDLRHVGRELHVVARQLHTALHARIRNVVDGQAELQLQIGIRALSIFGHKGLRSD